MPRIQTYLRCCLAHPPFPSCGDFPVYFESQVGEMFSRWGKEVFGVGRGNHICSNFLCEGDALTIVASVKSLMNFLMIFFVLYHFL